MPNAYCASAATVKFMATVAICQRDSHGHNYILYKHFMDPCAICLDRLHLIIKALSNLRDGLLRIYPHLLIILDVFIGPPWV